MISRASILSLALIFAGIFTGCSSPRYEYRYRAGKTAVLQGGQAYAPPSAPPAVHAAVAAANEIAGAPYVYGGGHGRRAGGFDCSGATSYVLRSAGLLESSMPSSGFRRYGQKGEGEWISVWARKGHVFLVIAGLRFDTGWTGGRSEGPRWTTKGRSGGSGCTIRHPRGL